MRTAPLLAIALSTFPAALPAQERMGEVFGLASENSYLVAQVVKCVTDRVLPAEDRVMSYKGSDAQVDFSPDEWFEISEGFSEPGFGSDATRYYFWEGVNEDRGFDGFPEPSEDGLDVFDFTSVEGLEIYRETLMKFLNQDCLANNLSS